MESCTQTYKCMVSSYGAPPAKTTYFIEPEDPAMADDLAFMEFGHTLRTRLNEVGYIRTEPKEAALCIVLSYYVGDEEYLGTTTTTKHESYTKDDRTTNSTTNSSTDSTKRVTADKVQVRTNTTSNTLTQKAGGVRTITDVTTDTYTRFARPVEVVITAYRTDNNKKVWEVIVNDQIGRVNNKVNTSFRRLMPWILTTAQPYFGRSWEGRAILKEKDGKKLGLVWPYD